MGALDTQQIVYPVFNSRQKIWRKPSFLIKEFYFWGRFPVLAAEPISRNLRRGDGSANIVPVRSSTTVKLEIG